MALLTPAQIADQLRELIGTPAPTGRGSYLDAPQIGRWTGRAVAALKAFRGEHHLSPVILAASSGVAMGSTREQTVIAVLIELETALAEIELERLGAAADSGDAAFAAGQSLDVYKRLSQTFDRAQRRLRIVDPYMDEIIVTDYLRGLRNSSVHVEILTNDRAEAAFARFVAAANRLTSQTGVDLSVRLSREIHDRVIFIDDVDSCVVMGASLKDAGMHRPTYLTELDSQIGAAKRVVYDAIWERATPVSLR